MAKYPDGTEIVQYPKYLYHGGKAQLSADRKSVTNAVLVKSEKEHKDFLKANPDFIEHAPEGEDEPKW